MQEIPKFQFLILRDGDSNFLPSRGTSKSTGWDVRAAPEDKQALHIRPGQHFRIPLGIKAFCPNGWWLELRPRSSTFGKRHLSCLYGVIDEDYEGELLFACQYLPDIKSMGSDLVIEYGEAIGQIIPVKRQEMLVEKVSFSEYNRLCHTRGDERGQGGFGSTTK